MNDKKIKVLTISDHPFSPSGVGTQTKYVIEALLQSGKFSVISLGGAIRHDNPNPQKTDVYGDDWIIFPVEGYGNQDIVRSVIRNYKPDILWFMTDPRFYDWLWAMEHEIRSLVPMVYYHVWDNYPYPTFNERWYRSNDCIATISKVTDDIVANVAPEVKRKYIPHAVDPNIFKKFVNSEDLQKVKDFKQNIGKITIETNGGKFSELLNSKEKFIFFWNSRNARRKQSGFLIYCFKEFLDLVGHDKAVLVMHTDPFDPAGQNLPMIIEELGLDKGQVLLSTDRIPPDKMAILYNMADCTVSISDAEGFGLSNLESLSCGKPIIVTLTGGMQDQVTDGLNWFGVGIEPASKAVIGSQDVPWIYEDRVSQKDVVSAMKHMYDLTREERKSIGEAALEHVNQNFNFEKFKNDWVELMLEVHEEFGSWDTRKNYKSWELMEI